MQYRPGERARWGWSGLRRLSAFPLPPSLDSNPLGWTRTDHADLPWESTEPVHVIQVDSGTEVRSQIVTVGGERKLRISAQDVPPVGYRTYEIVPGGQAFGEAPVVRDGTTMKNSLYRVSAGTSGAVTSFVDKRRGHRELVRSIGGRLLNDLGGSDGTVQVEDVGPVSVTSTSAIPFSCCWLSPPPGRLLSVVTPAMPTTTVRWTSPVPSASSRFSSPVTSSHLSPTPAAERMGRQSCWTAAPIHRVRDRRYRAVIAAGESLSPSRRANPPPSRALSL